MDRLRNTVKEFRFKKKKGNLKHIYKNELNKAFFSHNAAYSDRKDLPKKTISVKILKDKAYEIATNSIYDDYNGGLAGMIYNIFDKKTGLGAITTDKVGASVNEVLTQQLHKPVIKIFERKRVYAKLKNTILVADLAETGSLYSKSWGVKYYYV